MTASRLRRMVPCGIQSPGQLSASPVQAVDRPAFRRRSRPFSTARSIPAFQSACEAPCPSDRPIKLLNEEAAISPGYPFNAHSPQTHGNEQSSRIDPVMMSFDPDEIQNRL
jgi:hypothetical protein